MTKNNFFSLLPLVFLCLSTQPANAQIMYGSYGGTQQGVTVSDSLLNQSTVIPTPFTPISITAGLANTFYLTNGNNIYRYSANGLLLKTYTFTFDAGIIYTGATVTGGNLYVTYKGSQWGVSVRNPTTLVQTNLFWPGGPKGPDAIAAGPAATLFIAAGNHLFKLTNGGAVLIDMAFPDLGLNYTGVAVKGNRVYASYNGNQQGFAIFDLNLVQLSGFGTPYSPTGIAAGLNNDVYLSTAEHLYRYTTSGSLLKDVTSATINYTGISAEKSQ